MIDKTQGNKKNHDGHIQPYPDIIELSFSAFGELFSQRFSRLNFFEGDGMEIFEEGIDVSSHSPHWSASYISNDGNGNIAAIVFPPFEHSHGDISRGLEHPRFKGSFYLGNRSFAVVSNPCFHISQLFGHFIRLVYFPTQ